MPAEGLDAVLADYSDYIARQVLASAVATEPVAAGTEGLEQLDIDGLKLEVLIRLS